MGIREDQGPESCRVRTTHHLLDSRKKRKNAQKGIRRKEYLHPDRPSLLFFRPFLASVGYCRSAARPPAGIDGVYRFAGYRRARALENSPSRIGCQRQGGFGVPHAQLRVGVPFSTHAYGPGCPHGSRREPVGCASHTVWLGWQKERTDPDSAVSGGSLPPCGHRQQGCCAHPVFYRHLHQRAPRSRTSRRPESAKLPLHDRFGRACPAGHHPRK